MTTVMEMAMVMCVRGHEWDTYARVRACSRARARRGVGAAEAANCATVAKGR